MMFADSLTEPGYAFLAPEAPGSAWYPNSFLAPLISNEPYLSSALQRIERLLAGIQDSGIPLEGGSLLCTIVVCEFMSRVLRAPRTSALAPVVAAHRAGLVEATPARLGRMR